MKINCVKSYVEINESYGFFLILLFAFINKNNQFLNHIKIN